MTFDDPNTRIIYGVLATCDRTDNSHKSETGPLIRGGVIRCQGCHVLEIMLLTVDFSPNCDSRVDTDGSRLDATREVLGANLDFHGANSSYGSHAWHPFPAKFPPQLPEFVIRHLSDPGDTVLDPMLGSGTTLVEALRLGRRAIGCDIDPLSRMIATAKLTPVDPDAVLREGTGIIEGAHGDYHRFRPKLQEDLELRFDEGTYKFIQYWFLPQQQLEMLALIQRIEALKEGGTRDFLRMIFSSTIIAKSGGVSLARDLAHTRPHRDTQKTPPSAFTEFAKRLERIIATFDKHELNRDIGVMSSRQDGNRGLVGRDFDCSASIQDTTAADTGLPPSSVDLIVTSPPYANNAIDYMRAHKFSLVWFGWKIAELSRIRSQYLGHDAISGVRGLGLPRQCEDTLLKLADRDRKKALALRRYFEEMQSVAREMRRVLRSGKPAVIVVGSSRIKGLDVETHKGLAAIGEDAGFDLAGIGERQLDRDKRMMPARWGKRGQSQIEERMHEEYVIGLVKS